MLFELMKAIREASLSGSMECSVGGGTVLMVHFEAGRPLDDPKKISGLVHLESIVLAWMPRKASEDQTDSSLDDRQRKLRALESFSIECAKALFQDEPRASADGNWLALLHSGDVLVNSHEDSELPGVSTVAGMVAQINGAFKDIFADRPLLRATVDFSGRRIGYETVRGNWRLIYNIDENLQKLVPDVCGNLDDVLVESGADELEDAHNLESRVTVDRDTDYLKFRPDKYNETESAIRMGLDASQIEWDQIWFRYADKVVCSIDKSGEQKQEVGGAVETLVQTVNLGMTPLVGYGPSNAVFHAPGTTLWMHFMSPLAFWVTRFESDDTIWRETAFTTFEIGAHALETNFGESL